MTAAEVERQSLDIDIACVGFGPAMGGFLSTLSRRMLKDDGTPVAESRQAPGLPPQVVCYERAEDPGFAVSGVATRGRALRESFPDLRPEAIPMAAEIREERLLYLLDPVGASRRSGVLKAGDAVLRALRPLLPLEEDGLALPYIPAFLRKHGGLILSIGQFNQWTANQIMAAGLVQIWPGTPVSGALLDGRRMVGVRLADQGTDRLGRPERGYLPGMEVRADLTVIGDGPVGSIGREVDRRLGVPSGHHAHDWALGMKFVVDLRPDAGLRPGTVWHTFGYPEPEIFGFLYVHPGDVASLGIFVPSWFASPVRTAYRYLQHWMLHPRLWRHLRGGRLRSWGAKTLGESGRRGEPFLVGDGYARIGEGSGSTNVLTGSGVDEAWETGVLLAEAVLELMREGKRYTKENLEKAYVARRRASRVEAGGRAAEKARDGFAHGLLAGLVGMALAGFTEGRIRLTGPASPPHTRLPSPERYYEGRIPAAEVRRIRAECAAAGIAAHGALMTRSGWPEIPFDGRLLVSHQDALLIGGKVHAPPGYADHVVFIRPELCVPCVSKLCVEMCSGQAIAPGERGVPVFDREKCVHCGACQWSCATPHPLDPGRTVLEFRAGAGGLHSSEN